MAITITFILLAIGAVLGLYVRMLRKENRSLYLQEQLIRGHYEALEAQSEEVRRLRHDIANHIYTVEQLAVTGEESQNALGNCQAALEKTYRTMQKSVWSGELLIDSAISGKLRACGEKEIETHCAIESFSVGDIDRVDMLGLLYNIFDNAIEACERIGTGARTIDITIRNDGDRLRIDCRNTKGAGSALVPGEKTSKRDKASHGVGRDIIKGIVRKYHGGMKVTEEADTYRIEVDLPTKAAA